MTKSVPIGARVYSSSDMTTNINIEAFDCADMKLDLADLRQKYDRLIHLHEETNLPREEVVEATKKIFPEFNDIALYDKVVGGYEAEMYMQARGKGLSVEEAAHAAEVSYYVIQQALVGKGLTLESFVTIVKAELFAKAQLVNRLLSIIERSESGHEVNAAAMLLEKVDPRRYGKASQLHLSSDDDSVEEKVVVVLPSKDFVE